MKFKQSLIKYLLPFGVFSAIVFYNGCKESSTGPDSAEPSTDKEAYMQLISQDESVSSFEPNYNDDDAISFLGKVDAAIYPFRVGHRVHMVNRNLTTETIGDTTYGTLTTTFEGTLLIAASYSADSLKPDTLIQKPFTSVVTRKIIFQHIGSTKHPMKNWKIAAISLPEGGTINPNINITRLTVTLATGDQIIITSPNDYFLVRSNGFGQGTMHGNKFKRGFLRDMFMIGTGENVDLKVELTSAYADTDFVTLSWGAIPGGLLSAKKKFDLISSVPGTGGYQKVYEQSYTANNIPGFFHAIIDAFPRQVIYDDATNVENEMWGVPYVVKH